MRVLKLEGIDNVRDLGGIAVAGNRQIRPRLFYRGAALYQATAGDQTQLFVELGISCVIDLRCGWEVELKPNKVPDSVTHVHIPFYDENIVGIDYTEPAAGTRIIGKEIACNPNHFYPSLLNPLTVGQMRKAIQQSFSFAAQGLPVYQHCSGGKDRTGIMTLLLLTVLGASKDEILDDYLLTNITRDTKYDREFQRFMRLTDGNEALSHELVLSHRARPENLALFYTALDENYGSIDAFIENQLEISGEQREILRERCTEPIG